MRRILGIVFALAVVALSGAGRLDAQEVQVPMDQAGRILTVDRELADRLRLWLDEYPNFHEARLFQAPDSAYVLEITTERAGIQSRTRVPHTAVEVAALRARISALAASAAPDRIREPLNQEGRYLLTGQTSLAGLTFYGWAIPQVLNVDGSAAFGLYLLTAGASFFLPYALTEGQPVTFGMSNLSRYGVTRGILHGLLAHELVAGEGEPPTLSCPQDALCYDVNDDGPERARTAMALLGSVAEGVGGYLWARNEEMTPGTANALATAGDFGLAYGIGTTILLNLEGDDGPGRLGAALGLTGAAGGVLVGRGLARERDYSWGDTDLIYTAGTLGAWSGLASLALVSDDFESEEVAAGVAMLGSLAGLYLSDGLVRDTDFTVGQATLNRLGTVAGALAGASLGVTTESGRVAIVGSAIGGILGYHGTYRTLAPQARGQSGDRLTGLDLQLHPHALIAGGGLRDAALPLFSVRYRF